MERPLSWVFLPVCPAFRGSDSPENGSGIDDHRAGPVFPGYGCRQSSDEVPEQKPLRPPAVCPDPGVSRPLMTEGKQHSAASGIGNFRMPAGDLACGIRALTNTI